MASITLKKFETAEHNSHVMKNFSKMIIDAVCKKFPFINAGAAFVTFFPDLYHIAQEEFKFEPVRKELVRAHEKYSAGQITYAAYQYEIGKYGYSIRQKNYYLRKAVEDIIAQFDPTLDTKEKDEAIKTISDKIISKQRKELHNQLSHRILA